MNIEDNIYTKNERNKITPKTYITMITNLNFIAIEECDIEFITAFLLNTEENTVETKGYKISII